MRASATQVMFQKHHGWSPPPLSSLEAACGRVAAVCEDEGEERIRRAGLVCFDVDDEEKEDTVEMGKMIRHYMWGPRGTWRAWEAADMRLRFVG